MKELKQLHESLQRFDNYLSMIAIGSITTGDRWVDGRSDRDILFVFEDEKIRYDSISEMLAEYNFDDTYVFTPLPKQQFIGPINHSHDFSHKFRSRILFGKELTSRLPDRATTHKIYSQGLEKVLHRMQSRVMNAVFWSDEKIRKEFWKLYKHTFMYLAIKEYHDTGFYPRKRSDTANCEVLKQALSTLYRINEKSKDEIIETSKELLSFLKV